MMIPPHPVMAAELLPTHTGEKINPLHMQENKKDGFGHPRIEKATFPPCANGRILKPHVEIRYQYIKSEGGYYYAKKDYGCGICLGGSNLYFFPAGIRTGNRISRIRKGHVHLHGHQDLEYEL